MSKEPTARAREWLEPDGLTRITGWSRLGLTMQEIADNMNVSKTTLYKWSNDYVDIMNALKEGKEVTDFHVMNALYENALKGNVTAQIFWLKNRMSDQFKDRVEHIDNRSVEKLDQVLDKLEEQADETN